MSKLLNSVLDRISESNNDYRNKLRDLNVRIDEKTTNFVGDLVTASNYTADFSKTITSSKEELVNPVSRVIETYVIKDLRSVETVNEQFIEKINYKLESANLDSKEEKEKFIGNLDELLNDKYLEIVKIKRINFVDETGTNSDIEKIIGDYISSLKSVSKFDEGTLNDLFNTYKADLYSMIDTTLTNISNLYLNNFIEGVTEALGSSIDYEANVPEETFKPFMPDINPVAKMEAPIIEEPVLTETPAFDEVPEPIVPIMPEPIVPEMPITYDTKPLEVEPIEPVEIKVEDIPVKAEPMEKPIDVEEILKIAKSPVVTMNNEPKVEDDSYVSVSRIAEEKQSDTMESEFNEREIVEEMINRLTKRLIAIDAREAKYQDEKNQLEEDEAFVNDLIDSSSNKKEELDNFERELNDKDKELVNKKYELDKKINNVLPFANAVLNSEESR